MVFDLRRAGYLARHRWARETGPDGVYLDGPAQGLRVVDPWAEARTLSSCGARWAVHLRLGGAGLTPSPAPLPCGRGHLCPVCAADRAADYARAARAVIGDWQAQNQHGAAILVTLTQRADPNETLQAALTRLRKAWAETRKTDQWTAQIQGAFWGYEVTHKQKRGWHAHIHAVILVQDGAREHDARAAIGRAWRAATDAARIGWGWQPQAGGCRVAKRKFDRPDLEQMTARELRSLCGGGSPTLQKWGASVRGASRLRRADLVAALSDAWQRHTKAHEWKVISWAGPWWKPLENLDAVKQAAKYPTPAVQLSPLGLAEFVAVARGRRWHDGCGVLRGVLARARELGSTDNEADQTATDDLGPIINQTRPGAAPDLDAYGPALGWLDAAPTESGQITDAAPKWAVASDWQGSQTLQAAIDALGWTLQIGPVKGRGEWRSGATGEAPGMGETLWIVGDAAHLVDWLRILAPRHTKTIERKTAPNQHEINRPAWFDRPLPK